MELPDLNGLGWTRGGGFARFYPMTSQLFRDWHRFAPTFGIGLPEHHFNAFDRCQFPIFAGYEFHRLGQETIFRAFLPCHFTILFTAWHFLFRSTV